MASLRELLSNLRGRLTGGSPDAKALQERTLYPSSSGASDNLVRDMLRYPPGSNTLDIRPTRSVSNANGYMILTSPDYWDLLDEMYESDEVLRMCLELMVAYMLMRPQNLRVEGGDEEQERAAPILEFFQERIVDNPEINFRYLMWSLALGILRHGRSTNEVIWNVTGDGYFMPNEFIHCHPGQFGFDRRGKLHIQGRDLRGLVEPPPLKFISAVNPALYDNPWGDSKLFPFRYKYQYKKRVMVAKLQYLEWFGSPIIHAKVKAGGSDKARLQEELRMAIQNLQSSMALVTANDEEVDVHQRSSSGLGGGGGLHDTIIDRLDSYFVRALLGAELNTQAGERGARSLGEVHERTVLNKILPFARIIETSLNLGLFDPIRIMNFGADSPVVRYWFDTEETTDAADARATLESATTNGVPVTVRQAQEMLGIWPATENDELLKKPQTTIQVPVPPANQTPADEADDEPATVVDFPPGDDDEEEAAAASEAVVSMAEHELSSTQLDMSPWIQDLAREFCGDYLTEQDLYVERDDEGQPIDGYGIVHDSHVTVLYGIDPSATVNDVERAAAGAYWQWIELGALNYFEADDYDVLYVEVEPTSELLELRSYLQNGLSYRATRSDYIPHMTLAYVRKGVAKRVVDSAADYFMGVDDFVEYLTFSTADDERYLVWLTGPEISMRCDRTSAKLDFILQKTRLPVSQLWKVHPDSEHGAAAVAFKQTVRERSEAAEKQAREWERKLADAIVEDTRPQVIKSVQATAARLEQRGRDARMISAMRSDADIGPLEIKVWSRRVVLCTFMMRTFVASMQVDYVGRERQKDFADDLIAKLPADFRDAAEWMASRGVMTVEQVQRLAEEMHKQFGGELEQWETQLRDHYLALARTAELGATKKIQGMIEQAVEQGKTLNEFLASISSMIEAGDMPGGLDGYWETVFRTEVGNAYKHAQEINESDPDFEPYHWGWEGYNPQDERSDPTHAKVDGKKFKKGSAAANALGLPPWRYNCRCGMYALMTPDPEHPDYKESRNALSIASQVSRF